MQADLLEIAEFTAYIVAVLVGLDMIAERWLPCYRTKNSMEASPNSPASATIENGETSSPEISEVSFGDFREN